MDEADVFRLASEHTRHMMLVKLSRSGSATAGELVKATGRTQPLVSHHLRVLKEAGVLKSRRDGRNMIYSIRGKRIERAFEKMNKAAAEAARLCR